jgi:hypothetical protein
MQALRAFGSDPVQYRLDLRIRLITNHIGKYVVQRGFLFLVILGAFCIWSLFGSFAANFARLIWIPASSDSMSWMVSVLSFVITIMISLRFSIIFDFLGTTIDLIEIL